MKFLKEPISKLREKLKNREKLTRFNLIFYMGIVAVVIALVVGLLHQTLAYKSFEVINSIDKNDNVSVSYQVIGNGLLRYSKDGVSYSEKLDSTIWNQSFEMASARVVNCGDYLAIGDIGSNQVRIFNQAGQVGGVTTPHPIVDLAVADQGVVAVVLTEGDSNYIYLYDNKGEELVTIKTNVGQMGYPLDFALSKDAQKLVVNYLSTKEGKIATNMVFYNFGESGNNEIDHIMGSFEYEGLYPKVEFLDNNSITAYGEQDFILYSMTYKPEVIKEVEFGKEIKSLFVSDKYLGFVFRNNMEVAEGEKVPDGKYHMEVYTTAGRLYMQKDFDFEYTTITNTNQEIIMYNDSQCVIYTFSGKEKFHYTFSEPIIKLLPKTAKDEYILIGSSAIQEILLK